ncbi:MAG: hypothetical protein GW858_06655 [Sphingomonadales bacterium]|nr:hypothetical protein [Sphingomonadales bacterium]NCQ21167.1 hypothetical protein [Sphingomonadales bacterium]NCT03940.1 hypothetical protein [Sphingomonadales bacterium]
MIIATGLTAALMLAASVQYEPPMQPKRLPDRPPPAPATEAEPERIPIDLGAETWPNEPPQSIDILAPPIESEAANAAALKECEDQRDVGIVAGEIVVCRELEVDTSQLYSGSREAWLKDYAARTQNAGTLPPPDVAGPGIFRGPATVGGLCLIGLCPDEPALIVDVEAIPPPPAGSDAARVAEGLAPLEEDNAPLSDEARSRVEAELGLPQAAPGE